MMWKVVRIYIFTFWEIKYLPCNQHYKESTFPSSAALILEKCKVAEFAVLHCVTDSIWWGPYWLSICFCFTETSSTFCCKSILVVRYFVHICCREWMNCSEKKKYENQPFSVRFAVALNISVLHAIFHEFKVLSALSGFNLYQDTLVFTNLKNVLVSTVDRILFAAASWLEKWEKAWSSQLWSSENTFGKRSSRKPHQYLKTHLNGSNHSKALQRGIW